MKLTTQMLAKILSCIFPPSNESSSEIDCSGVIWSRESIDAVKRAGAVWTSGKKIPGPEWRE